MYSREQIDKVRASIDIVDVIREYVPTLKVMGRSAKGLCPFHGERTPSFHVHAEKGIFKCFGCGEGGDVISFLMKIEQIGFWDALENLAQRAGIPLRRESHGQKQEPEGLKDKLYRLLQAAARFYENRFWEDPKAEKARKYLLEERAIKEETARLFQVGFSPVFGETVFEHLLKKGFTIEECQQAGLVQRSAQGRYYDPFFGRILFTIFDTFGHVIGFGGRLLPAGKTGPLTIEEENSSQGPKYLNSPETPVFSKGKSLYGLYQAKSAISANRQTIVLEGYMDVLGVFQAGSRNVVATLGTALTPDHAKLLKRYSDETILFFDPDQAGQNAAIRGVPCLLKEDIFPRVAMTDETADPDDIILAKGKEFFDGLLASAPDFLDFLLKIYRASIQMDPHQKSELVKKISEVIRESTNDVLKAEWGDRLARSLGIKSELVEKNIRATNTPSQSKFERPARVRSAPLPQAEEELLELIIQKSELWNDLDLSAEDFVEDSHKIVFSAIQKQVNQQGRLVSTALLEELPEKEKALFLRWTMAEKDFSEPKERRDQLINDIRNKRTKDKLKMLSQRIVQGLASSQEEEEYRNLLKRVKGSSQNFVNSIPT
jgi:DNA primase